MDYICAVYTKGADTMEKHFCNCPELECKNHPSNHTNGCDPCIVKNLKQGEIPSCFFLSISKEIDDLDKFTYESFVDFFIKHRREQSPTSVIES